MIALAQAIAQTLLRPFIWRAWAWRICWRSVNGRWFIFRDAPDWVVVRFMGVKVAGLGEQAADEMIGRLSKRVREFTTELNDALLNKENTT